MNVGFRKDALCVTKGWKEKKQCGSTTRQEMTRIREALFF